MVLLLFSEEITHVMDLEKEELGSSKAHPSRIANGTWIGHKASSGVAKMFRRVTAMLPFVNFESSELWQVLSYHRGGHYAPHYDYIDDEKDSWSPRYGSRFATFLLMLQPATKGGALFCYTRVFNYQTLNVEVLSEDPVLIVYKNFAPDKYVADFLADVRWMQLEEQRAVVWETFDDRRDCIVDAIFIMIWSDYTVVDVGEVSAENIVDSTARRANGTFANHEEFSGVAKMFRRIETMIPFVNFRSAEPWQILSYHRGGHYAPHWDYIEYNSPDQWPEWRKWYGERFATFLLMLQPATRGGAGDAIFWTNVNVNEEQDPNSLHAACPVWEGEKVATTLWVHAADQELLRKSSLKGGFDIDKLINPHRKYSRND
ncbi:oxidoreductase, 2OG-Fe(II) oxygenase family protein [Teladorsagia circumcincta]|uniref:Oxidoreductase, 2OG-Fe(II) oxygenase family protein n=1 Tax=Teladorsagia circumcincta TaxID=45464 RepID=A0A2G9UYD0_TELCI|nr:oxidoreductase, 2OG-Fe(II) oxygenase family protein [Teladorsagia circumcincta]